MVTMQGLNKKGISPPKNWSAEQTNKKNVSQINLPPFLHSSSSKPCETWAPKFHLVPPGSQAGARCSARGRRTRQQPATRPSTCQPLPAASQLQRPITPIHGPTGSRPHSASHHLIRSKKNIVYRPHEYL